MLQQHPRGLQMTVIAGQHQQGVALVIAQIDGQAAGQQAHQHRGIALAGTVEDFRGEGCSLLGIHADGCSLIGHKEPP